MRHAYVHDAVVELDDGDLKALGAAITTDLCGDFSHEPPCPLAPHHTSAWRRDQGAEVQVRVLFATEEAHLDEVRSRIENVLLSGRFTDPRGILTAWRLCSTRPGILTADDHEHAARLMAR